MKFRGLALAVAGLTAIVGLTACGSSDGGGSGQGIDGGAGASGPGAGAAASGDSGSSGGGGGASGSGMFGTGGAGAGGSGASGSGANGSGASGSGATTGSGGPVTRVTPVSSTDACATQTLGANGEILDVFIMLDRSGSMGDATPSGPSKWESITQAIETFAGDPASAGIGAGISFFGIAAGNNESSCDFVDYASAVVPIAPLNGNAGPITNAIGNQSPGGRTPTEPALAGALAYASAWAQQNPTHKVIVVLATDGAPNGCNSSPEGVATIAQSGVDGTPSIPTYVIGVVGEGTGDGNCPNGPDPSCEFVQSLNTMADGGGTGTAFIVNTSADPGAEFLSALNAIRNANQVGCDFSVPAPTGGGSVDFSRATVQYTAAGTGTPDSIVWTSAESGCDGTTGGWYYNSLTAPNHITLCDATCSTVMADPNAQIDVRLACLPPGTGGPGDGGSGGGGGGASGTDGGGGTGINVPCLLLGQSCSGASQCCSGVCSGVCTQLR